MGSPRVLAVLLPLFISFGAAEGLGPMNKTVSVAAGLASEEVIVVDVERFIESTDGPVPSDGPEGLPEPVVDMGLEDIGEAMGPAAVADPVVEDAISRVDEWSEVSLDYGDLDFRSMGSKQLGAWIFVKVGGRNVPLGVLLQSRPVFISIRKVGGESMAGKKIGIDQVSCDLYPSVPTGNSRDKISCEGLFDVSVVSDQDCQWFTVGTQGAAGVNQIGRLVCGAKQPEVWDSVGNLLKRVFGGSIVATALPGNQIGRVYSCSDLEGCSKDSVGNAQAVPAAKIRQLEAGIGELLKQAYAAAVRSFSTGFISGTMPSAGKMILGLRRMKFEINPGVRVAGVTYVGTVNLNIRSS